MTVADVTAAEQLEARVRRAEVSLVYSQARAGFAISLFNGAVLFGLLRGVVSTTLLGIWLVLLAIVSAARALLVRAHARAPDRLEDEGLWRSRFVVSGLFGGIVWGVLGGLLFPTSSIVHQLAIGFVLAGLAAGSVTYFSAVPNAYYAFAATALVPYATRLVTAGGAMQATLGGLTFLYAAALAANARRVHQVIRESFHARFVNEELVLKLRASEKIKAEFIATVSHELRTPLTAIKGAVDLLAGGVGGELEGTALDLVSTAAANAVRLRKLVDELLDFEKLGADTVNLIRRRVGLLSLLDEVVACAVPFAQQHGARIVRVASEDVEVETDPDRLAQVITNLLSNAAKFSREGGLVEASVRREEGVAIVSVRDYGVGIPESFRERIFQRFSQVDSSDTRAKGGTGLGLSISKAIMDKLGGAISYESELGLGTTFRVAIPVGIRSITPPSAPRKQGGETLGDRG